MITRGKSQLEALSRHIHWMRWHLKWARAQASTDEGTFLPRYDWDLLVNIQRWVLVLDKDVQELVEGATPPAPSTEPEKEDPNV